MKDMNIVYLWAEVTGYVVGVLEQLTMYINGSINVVHWDARNANTTKYKIGQQDRVIFHRRSTTTNDDIYNLLLKAMPDIVVVSGWMDQGYIYACKRYKKRDPSVKIVAGIDDQWTGSFRQRIGQIYYELFYRKLFDFMWVSGKPQYSYAERFGYGINTIITNLYSADSRTFNSVADPCKRFVFVGRFVKVKALDLLVAAYRCLPAEKQEEWPLVLIGDGDQKDMVQSLRNPNIRILPFMQPQELRAELQKGGVACLTSHKDQWGVVVHEYALMGLPMLLSSGCGAATEFLIPGYNGYMFEKGIVESLYQGLLRFTSLSDNQLREFGYNSAKLGSKINNELSAQSLLSVMYL